MKLAELVPAENPKTKLLKMRSQKFWPIVRLIASGVDTIPSLSIASGYDDNSVKRLLRSAGNVVWKESVRNPLPGGGRDRYYISPEFTVALDALLHRPVKVYENKIDPNPPKPPEPTEYELLKLGTLIYLNRITRVYLNHPTAVIDAMVFIAEKKCIRSTQLRNYLWPLRNNASSRASACNILFTLKKNGFVLTRSMFFVHPECLHIGEIAKQELAKL